MKTAALWAAVAAALIQAAADGGVAQHRGVENGAPPARHVALLRGWRARMVDRSQGRAA